MYPIELFRSRCRCSRVILACTSQETGAVMTRVALASLLIISLAAPAFAANEKPPANPAKGKGWHCRKLANEKYHIQDGRALNKGVEAAVQRCREHGPSAL
jgi:hypothetical protein